MQLIPAIDLKDGQCVRLRQGRMEDSTVFSKDPVAMAAQWVTAGATRLHLVDLDGAMAGFPVNADIIRQIAENHPEIEIQIGGGIRNVDVIQTYLDVGVDFVIVGTQAVRDPGFVDNACLEFPGHVIVGLDARDGRVATHGWEQVSDIAATELAKRFEDAGVEAIVFTDIGRDGMMNGFNAKATADLAKAIEIPVIASGGVSSMADVERLCEIADVGVTGAIVGRALYEHSLDFAEAQAYANQQMGR